MFPSPGMPSLCLSVAPQLRSQASLLTRSPPPWARAPGERETSCDHLLSCVSLCRSRTRGPIGPGKYGYGKAPYILPLQTDSSHSPQRLRRQRPSAGHSRPQGPSGPSHGYSPPTGRASQHGPLYQSDGGPRSGLQAAEASVYHLPLTHDQGFPAASSLFHSPETSSNHGMGAHRAAPSFSQPARSAAISCIGAYRQYKLCNPNVSTQGLVGPGLTAALTFLSVGGKHVGDSDSMVFLDHVNALLSSFLSFLSIYSPHILFFLM